MYLSRLVLNGRSRDARSWLADCHALHRLIMSGFPDLDSRDARSQLGVLHRVERMTDPPAVPVIVQSRVEPRWAADPEAIIDIDGPKPLDHLLERIQGGERFRFRLRANPSRRVHRRATLGLDPEKPRQRPEKPESAGKRVELAREEDQLGWLRRKGEASGFALMATRLLPAGEDVTAVLASGSGKIQGRREARRMTLGSVLFEGLLEVTDAQRFRQTLETGIGPGKAFGLGLLSVAPVAVGQAAAPGSRRR